MSYAPVSYTGDGVTTNYTVTFPYISEDEVVVTVDGASASYSFLSESIIQFSTAPADGAKIYIERDTDDDSQIIIWQNGVALTKDQLNTAVKQLFYMAQEAKAVTERTIYKNYTGAFTAEDLKIIDVADPEDDTDVANKGYVDGVFEAYEPTILGYVSDAENAKDAAEAAEAGVATDAAAAAASATSASTSSSEASVSASSASDSEAKAQQWAEEDEDVEVETGLYSSKHWAAKAAEYAQGSAVNISVTPTGNIISTDVQSAIEELDSDKADASHNHDATYLGITDTATDSDKVDGLDADQFLRSDTSDTMVGDLTVQGDLYVGLSGGGNSQLHFYDDTNSTWRSIVWSTTEDAFRVELNSEGWGNMLTTANIAYGGTWVYNPTFPIGTYLSVYMSGNTPGRTAATSVRLGTDGTGATYVSSGTGTLLDGSWRLRGKIGSTGYYLAQRIS